MTSYSRPDFLTLKARAQADLAAMPNAVRTPLSAMHARATHGLHGHINWVDEQGSPLTCIEERLYDWATLYGVDRLAPTAATGTVTVEGVIGAEILADTIYRGLNGLDYTVVSAVTFEGDTADVTIRCETAGALGNLASGETVTLVDPIFGVSNTAVVGEDGVTGGEEEEAVEDWRARVADEWRVAITDGARSGKDADYRAWAKNAHPSVTTALVFRHLLGIGTVVVYPVCNALENRLPTQAVLDSISAYYERTAPATADWRVGMPTPIPVDVTLSLAAGYDTEENRTAITSTLKASVLAEASETSKLTPAEIDIAIATVTSEYARVSPIADIEVSPGEVLVLGNVIFG